MLSRPLGIGSGGKKEVYGMLSRPLGIGSGGRIEVWEHVMMNAPARKVQRTCNCGALHAGTLPSLSITHWNASTLLASSSTWLAGTLPAQLELVVGLKAHAFPIPW